MQSSDRKTSDNLQNMRFSRVHEFFRYGFLKIILSRCNTWLFLVDGITC